jgi:hypothetical protein
MMPQGSRLTARAPMVIRETTACAFRAMRIGPWALGLLFASGCLVSSLHPLYEDDSIVFDDALLGEWENSESEITVSVSRGEWRSYQIAFTDRFGTTRFNGHLTTIGAARFLNILPHEGLEKASFIVATNGFMQIQIESARVRVREPDYDGVVQRLKARKLGVEAAMDLKQNVIVTAPSPKLRAWVAAALKDEALWADWKTFTRSAR